MSTEIIFQCFLQQLRTYVLKIGWMASCTSGLTHIKKNNENIYVIESNNLINIRVSHSELDHLVTDFVTFLC